MVVQPASARISIEPPSQLNLGEVLAGETAKGKLVAVNEGGVATYLKATMPSGVKILLTLDYNFRTKFEGEF